MMIRIFLLLMILLSATGVVAAELTNIFFLHHSTGRYLLADSGARTIITEMNDRDGSSFVFWDHDYNDIGLRNADGTFVGTYNIPDDNTDPDGLYKLWTTDNSARADILANHEVIAFKSCYPASDITSDAMLDQYKTWYLEIRDVLDQHPGHMFVVMSQPPRHRLRTDLAQADRARAFALWLGSEEFLAGHDNLVYFDFFNFLAHPDDGSAARNMLRWEYEKGHEDTDSHPNTLANETVGPVFVDFLCEVASGVSTAEERVGMGALKTLYR
jgi:hypothetical protein